MADTYEKDLGQKSSLAVNDYIRVVGSDNASYKQLVSDVAKEIIENYTGSSLGGTSQSVKSAFDSLNSNLGGISFTKKLVSANTAKSFTIPNGYRGILYAITSAPSCCGEYLLYATTTGNITTVAVKEASDITFTKSTNTLTVNCTFATTFVFLNATGQATA